METGLIALKFLNLSGRFLNYFFRFSAGFFRWLLKNPLYGILSKVYYTIFRLKKTGAIKKSPLELIRTKYVYVFILLLSITIIFSNFNNRSAASNLEAKIPKTVLANLVTTEFDGLITEELIEETATPNSILTAGKEKYLTETCTLDKQANVAAEDTTEIDYLALTNEGDIVFKPYLSLNQTNEAGEIETPARQEIIYYTVQNGDIISTIARRFGISANTILWANNLSAYSLIRPGDRLTILPYSGVLYTVKKGDTLAKIARKYNIEVAKILSCNTLGNTLGAGQKIIIPGAKKISEAVAVTRTSTSYTGISAIKNLIKAPSSKANSAKMVWPTAGHRITQYFSWRHPGVDIANKVGTPLYAAESGTVEFAGWATGYGYSIVINHGGGMKTRYGHASKLFVKAGDEVERGENIAAMGSTGWSTGPHIHFEVIINGGKYNPLNYIR